MITCNRCGSMSPDSAVSCQNCGASLSSNGEVGLNPSRAFQEQPELPAWLESLRAGERPAVSADNPSSFSTADLIEEGSLPSWMRSGRSEMNDTSTSSPHLTLRPSSAPGPNTDDSRGINVQSLIDEQSLPSWMQENKQPTGPQDALAASSLIQRDLMPDWMKSLQQSSPAVNPAPPSVQPMSPLASGFPERSGPLPLAENTNEVSSRSAQGFSARDLVDQQSLPSWMTQQEGKAAPPPAQPAPGETLSPSSLIDVDALPSWLRENIQQKPRSGGLPPVQTNNPWQSTQPPMQAGGIPQSPFGQPEPSSMQAGSPVWQAASPQMPPASGMSNASAQSGGLSASSFIDPNALPQWLRSGSEQQNQVGNVMPPQQPVNTPRTGYNIPPRVENVRVPSRPRGEINSNNDNEAAANAFASMLGVASTAPNFPGAPPAQGYGMQGGSSGQVGSAFPMPPIQGASPANTVPGQMAGAVPGFNNLQGMQGPSQTQNYAPGGFNNGMYQAGNQGQGNYPTGNSFSGAPQYPARSSGMPSTPMSTGNVGMESGGGQRASTKPAKKGLFDTIRDWFR